jgi:hypothetical protein
MSMLHIAVAINALLSGAFLVAVVFFTLVFMEVPPPVLQLACRQVTFSSVAL